MTFEEIYFFWGGGKGGGKRRWAEVSFFQVPEVPKPGGCSEQYYQGQQEKRNTLAESRKVS